MRVAFGTDEQTAMTAAVLAHLAGSGHAVDVVANPGWWPDVGRAVAEAVATGDADAGVVCCWTGTGVSIAANKVAGARAALCTDVETARGARRWNDANVVALSLRLTSEQVAREIVDAFLSTEADPHEAPAVAKLD
ncbi:MAG: RpiB/LacA/LacB family sugar-phosphate isomerase [Acidimicrobiales bacterium]